MALTFGLGTARFITGNLNRIDKQNIDHIIVVSVPPLLPIWAVYLSKLKTCSEDRLCWLANLEFILEKEFKLSNFRFFSFSSYVP